MRGASGGPTSLPKNIAIAAKGLDAAVGVKKPLGEYATYQAGEKAQEFIKEKYPLPEKRPLNFGEKLSYGFGQTLGFVAGGVASRAVKASTAVVPLLFGQSAVDLFEQAEAAGKTDGEKYQAWMLGLGLDASEALPVSRLLDRVNTTTGGTLTQFVKKAALGGIEEAGQEFLQEASQQKVETELIGEGIREGEGTGQYFSGAVESAELGGIIGTTMNILGMAAGLPSVGRTERRAAQERIDAELEGLNKQLDQIEQTKDQAPTVAPAGVSAAAAADPSTTPKTKVVEVKGVGKRAFPESMSDEEIQAVLRSEFPAESSTAIVQEVEIGESEGTISESIKRSREEEFLPEKFEGMVPSLQEKLEPQGRAQILKDLSKKLQIPFRSGRFGSRAFGVYKPQQHVIRSKVSHDISNIAHEIGHHIHNVLYPPQEKSGFLDIKPLKPYAQELTPLGKPTSPGKNPTQPRLIREGYANFVRMYLTEPVTSKEVAPKFYEFFESEIAKHGDLSDVLQHFRAQVKLYAEMPALAKVDSMIDTDPEQPASTNRWQKFYTSVVDRFKPLQDAVDLMEESGAAVSTDENAYKLARLFQGWAGKADHFLQFGTFASGSLDVTGKGLKKILEPVADDLDNLRRFLVSTRAIEKAAQGIDAGIDSKTAQEALTQLQGDVGDDQVNKYAAVAEDLYKYQSSLLDYLESSGVMDPELRQKFEPKNALYVPFFRVMEEAPVIGKRKAGTRKLTDLWQPTKRMKGSRRPIIDPLESIVKNTYTFINLAERNRVAQAMVKQAEASEGAGWLVEDVTKKMVPTSFKLGEIKKEIEPLIIRELQMAGAMKPGEMRSDILSESDLDSILTIFRPEAFAPKGQNIISVFRDGKRKFYQLHPELYKTMQGLDEEEVNFLMRVLAAPAKILRLGATALSPEFSLRNPVRDAEAAFVQSESGFVPGLDSIRGLFHVLRRDDLYQEWIRSGGAHAAMISLDRTHVKQSLKDLMASKKEWVMMHPVEALRVFSEATEAMTRVGEFGKARGQGASRRESAFRSREVSLDFARIGTQGRIVNMITAFWNAGVQGTDKFVRVHKNAPKRALIRGSALTVIGLLSYTANRDEEWYQEAPRWLKDWAWLISAKGTPLEKYTPYITIPKPFLWGHVYSTVPERVMEWIDTRDKSAFDHLASSTLDQLNPGIVPTAVKPVIEAWANRNIFTGRRLDSLSMEMQKVDPTYRAHPYTSLWAQTTAQALKRAGIKVSPIVLDNTLYGYTGGLGRTVTKGVDMLTDDNAPAPHISDLPVMRAFTGRYPSSNSESVHKFYERLEELEGKKGTAKFAWDNGIELDPDERLTPAENFELAHLTKINTQMSEARKNILAIQRHKTMSPRLKRERIDALNTEIIRLARAAMRRKAA